MADIQREFETFHEAIRVDFDMSQTLREKRDIVVDKIKTYMKENKRPIPSVLLQGSYKMKTGVKPIEDMEYDIDVGLRFPISDNDYSAAAVRAWVLAAIGSHTKTVESRSSCIRVRYEAGYHLDIVSYAAWEDTWGKTQYRLAHKEGSWRDADPPALLQHVDDARLAFEDTEDSATQTDQFRRCVRAIRRWADELRPTDQDDRKPSGIAIVLLSIQSGLARHRYLDGRPDDRKALENLTQSLANTFGRLHSIKPTPEFEDLLAGFSGDDMEDLKKEFSDLHGALSFAGNNADPVAACQRLREVFGDDFPVPDPQDTAKKAAAPAIITSSSSA